MSRLLPREEQRLQRDLQLPQELTELEKRRLELDMAPEVRLWAPQAEEFQSCEVRYLKFEDLKDCGKIEARTYQSPWSVKEFAKLAQPPESLCAVACDGPRVLGYLFARQRESSASVINLTVDAKYRRRGVGSALLGWLAQRFEGQSKFICINSVQADDLETQMFLRFNGYKAVATSAENGIDSPVLYCFSRVLKPNLALREAP